MTGPGWWAPGDLDKMFERAVTAFPEFRPEVLSRPPEGPWVVHFFDFIKEPEIEALLRWGRKLGYQRSSDVGTHTSSKKSIDTHAPRRESTDLTLPVRSSFTKGRKTRSRNVTAGRGECAAWVRRREKKRAAVAASRARARAALPHRPRAPLRHPAAAPHRRTRGCRRDK